MIKTFTSSIGIPILLAAVSIPAFAELGNPRVNQLGYIPNGPKVATYANNSSSPLNWQLWKGNQLVKSGTTVPFGNDEASGEYVHQIDFSSVTTTGDEFKLRIGNDSSYPFEINADTFMAATFDSIRYFYHNRSGIEIETQYTGGGHGSYAPDSKWARPAGHLNVTPNKGDNNVACWPGTCDYSLNVTKGWYDAGDHGKYVVNGGISAWKLLNAYERYRYWGDNTDFPAPGSANRITPFADDMLNIPESGNNVPDVLDEARWQLEFLLAMQVPDGKPLAGMVHHKMHDEAWTGLPLAPHEDPNTRFLVPPTTAATLNVAAVGAQCARIWSRFDQAFANRCLSVAEKAWNAAKAHPDMIYGNDYNDGGGGYDDLNVADEFSWAASELYITTGQSKYLSDINTNLAASEWGWQGTQAAGVMSLATVTSYSNSGLRSQAQQSIIARANDLLEISRGEGYQIPLNFDSFYWGSNSVIGNFMILLGLAYEFTDNQDYLNEVGRGLDYLFGRNALSKSYVTGYGQNATKQPHHRFWAGALNNNYPWAPPGALAGGPNSGLEDDVSKDAVDGCQSRPQTCYVDDIGAWSTNEITINWNSALFWVLAFYDEYARQDTALNHVPVANVTVTPKTGTAPLRVTFDASASTDADGDELTATWDFGDGTSGEGLVVDHLYTQTGRFGSIGEISDGNGGKVGVITFIDITGSQGNTLPVAKFSASTKTGPAPLTVQFDGSESYDNDGDPLTYRWLVKNQQVGTSPQLSYTFTDEGLYFVELIVNDGKADSVTAMTTINVTPPVTSGDLSCTLTANSWNNGYTASVKVTNQGSTTLNSWQVNLLLPAGHTISNTWSASFDTTQSPIVVSNNNWNGTLAPGASVEFGFQAGFTGSYTAPSCQ
ncbi:glycoside hydrolase family 9 protein [Gynuella sp.]|uniref:glycoside hydrolase family 9 protein n=1 Tax=Gynuella sp. TaxID=2969146 RepID=UPI003D0FFC88